MSSWLTIQELLPSSTTCYFWNLEGLKCYIMHYFGGICKSNLVVGWLGINISKVEIGRVFNSQENLFKKRVVCAVTCFHVFNSGHEKITLLILSGWKQVHTLSKFCLSWFNFCDIFPCTLLTSNYMISLQFCVISTWKTTYFTYPTGLCNFLVWKIYLCLCTTNVPLNPFITFTYCLLFTTYTCYFMKRRLFRNWGSWLLTSS